MPTLKFNGWLFKNFVFGQWPWKIQLVILLVGNFCTELIVLAYTIEKKHCVECWNESTLLMKLLNMIRGEQLKIFRNNCLFEISQEVLFGIFLFGIWLSYKWLFDFMKCGSLDNNFQFGPLEVFGKVEKWLVGWASKNLAPQNLIFWNWAFWFLNPLLLLVLIFYHFFSHTIFENFLYL